MTRMINNEYYFAKSFAEARKHLMEMYYEGEISRIELEEELNNIEYALGEQEFERRYYDESVYDDDYCEAM